LLTLSENRPHSWHRYRSPENLSERFLLSPDQKSFPLLVRLAGTFLFHQESMPLPHCSRQQPEDLRHVPKMRLIFSFQWSKLPAA
jgi:hypothetical protein